MKTNLILAGVALARGELALAGERIEEALSTYRRALPGYLA